MSMGNMNKFPNNSMIMGISNIVNNLNQGQNLD